MDSWQDIYGLNRHAELDSASKLYLRSPIKYGMTENWIYPKGTLPDQVGNDEAPFDWLRANGYLETDDLRPESPQMLRSITKAFHTRMSF